VIKIFLYGIIIISVFIIGYLAHLSMKSRSLENYGLVEGKLSQCPDTPNCICTEDYENKNYEPLKIQIKNKDSAWIHLKDAIVEAGGEIQSENSEYLWAMFVTPIFRFVDDFEARIDTVQSVIHLRSSSRVGDYDFGTNFKRVERVVEIFMAKRAE
jgi:uncharacterized protein (DUF1499 family)